MDDRDPGNASAMPTISRLTKKSRKLTPSTNRVRSNQGNAQTHKQSSARMENDERSSERDASHETVIQGEDRCICGQDVRRIDLTAAMLHSGSLRVLLK